MNGNPPGARLAWGLALASVLLLAFHYYLMWTMAATWAVGVVGWASVLGLLGPPLAALSLFVSLRSPRKLAAAGVSLAVLLIYFLLYAWMFLAPPAKLQIPTS